ncbi:hypothetical protein DICA4_E27600 [Diutina catenulata]
MSEAFDNYCLTCNQLCGSTSVYCSDECKEQDHYPAGHHDSHLVSPLLTPSFNAASGESPSPLLCYQLAPPVESVEALNLYTVSLNPTTSNSSLQSGASAVSDNYRKWLTALY